MRRERSLRGEAMKQSVRTVAAALLLIGSIAVAQGAKPSASAVSSPSVTTSAAAASAAGPSYVIGPADVLHIAVWKEPDLTATLPVRPDGMISLPLLNDVQAAGLTPMQL